MNLANTFPTKVQSTPKLPEDISELNAVLRLHNRKALLIKMINNMKMNFLTIFLLILISLVTNLNAQTYISDKQEVFGTWTKSNSPYYIYGEAIIPKDKTLTIDPGVIIKFKTGDNSHYDKSNFDLGILIVKGQLIAKGTQDENIIFTRNGNNKKWGCILILNSEQTSYFDYCIISHGRDVWGIVEHPTNSGIALYKANAEINHCTIANCFWGVHISFESKLSVKNSILFGNINNGIYVTSGIPTISHSLIQKEKNQLSENLIDKGNNLFATDPLFEDISNDNYTLKSNSPCIGVGENGIDIGAIPFKKTPNRIIQKQDDFATNLPPILSTQDISLSKNSLKAGETAQLSITLKNIGAGDANGVYINLSSDLTGLQFVSKTNFPLIGKNGGTQTINVEIKGSLDLPTADAVLKIEIIEPNFKVKIQGKQVKFPTREFLKPELLLAKFAVVENLSANPNNQIDINEQIDVKFAVQNIGQGNAENVNITITNNQSGVMLLGVVDNAGNLVRKNPTFNSINTGKYETITYRYFVNSEFTSNQLTFTITSTEKQGKYGFNQNTSVEINKVLQEEGYIRTVETNNENQNQGKVVIEDIPDFVSDVDQNIPTNSIVNDKTFAVIIGNETYTKEIKVKYALNDARIFKRYLQKTLGLPTYNIHYIENATFGQILDELIWINNVAKAYNGQAKIIFYYAGHGMPDEHTKSAFLLPVDGNSQNPQTAVKLADVYGKLTEFPSISVTVFLDACFSGSTRETNETMLAQGRGVKIKPKNDLLTGNLVVFSAATGDETAFPYSEKQHGMFTYFLLKKIQESKGNATLNELSNYITTNVTQQSVVVNKKSQTPQVNTSSQVQNTWQILRLK
jgi:hypothetical protein